MARCSKCGAINPEGSRFCGDCGASLSVSAAPEVRAQQPTRSAPTNPYASDQDFQTPGKKPAPANYPAGGLIAWSVISILLCLIPGIIALVQACNINSCSTVEEQDQRIRNTRIWCTVSTCLGILAILIRLA